MLDAAKAVQLARDASDSWHLVFPCDACAIPLIPKRSGVVDCGLMVSNHGHQFRYLPIDRASFPAQCHQRLNRFMESVATKAIARREPVIEFSCSLLLVLELESGPIAKRSLRRPIALQVGHDSDTRRHSLEQRAMMEVLLATPRRRQELPRPAFPLHTIFFALLFQYAAVQASPRQSTVFRCSAMSQGCAIPKVVLFLIRCCALSWTRPLLILGG